MKEQELRNALDAYIAGSHMPEEAQERVLSELRKEKPAIRKKISTGMILAFALLLVTFTALALIPRQAAVTEYGLWMYDEGKLIYQDKESSKPQVVLENEDIIHIAADTHNSGVYYITRNSEGQALGGVAVGGYAIIPGRKLGSEYSIQKFTVSGSLAYLLADTPQGKGQLWRVDTYDETYIKDQLLPSSGWQNEKITSFCIVDEKIIYAHSNETGLLSAVAVYDLSAVQEPLTVNNIHSLLEGYEQDGVHYLFALSTDETPRLVVINTLTGEKLDTETSLPQGSAELLRDRNTLYVMNGDGQQLASYNIATLSGKKVLHTLTIVNGLIANTEAGETAERLFHEKYPDVEIVHRSIDDPRVVATEMMANEGNFDIVTLQPGLVMTSVPALLRSGAIMDITDFGAIQAVKEDWRDVWDTVSVDGRQYGVPQAIMPYLWQVNENVAQLLDWSIPEGEWNWTEFEQLIDRAIAYNQQGGQHLYLLADSNVVPFIIDQYQQEFVNPYLGTADYQTERFQRILTIWKRLHDNELLYPYPSMLASGTSNDPQGVPNTLLRNTYLTLGSLKNETFVLPPIWDENTPQLAIVYPMCISGNARYPEEAAYFLACYASAEATSKQYYSNFGQWLKDGSLYDKEDPMGQASAANEALWNTALEMCEAVHEHKDLLRMHWRELLPKLVAGEITPETYMEIAQQQADMYIGE